MECTQELHTTAGPPKTAVAALRFHTGAQARVAHSCCPFLPIKPTLQGDAAPSAEALEHHLYSAYRPPKKLHDVQSGKLAATLVWKGNRVHTGKFWYFLRSGTSKNNNT